MDWSNKTVRWVGFHCSSTRRRRSCRPADSRSGGHGVAALAAEEQIRLHLYVRWASA